MNNSKNKTPTVKPRNFVAKNAQSTTGGNASGSHKDKKSAIKKGEVKHKGTAYSEGYSITSGIDTDRYTDMSGEGLEGPFTLVSGKVVYYDPAEGSYYDRDTDMYLSYDELQGHRTKQESAASTSEHASTQSQIDQYTNESIHASSNIEKRFYMKLADDLQKTLPVLVTPMISIDSLKLNTIVNQYIESTGKYTHASIVESAELIESIRKEFGNRIATKIQEETEKLNITRLKLAESSKTISWRAPADLIESARSTHRRTAKKL